MLENFWCIKTEVDLLNYVKYDIIMGIIKLGDIFDKEEKGHEYSGIL